MDEKEWIPPQTMEIGPLCWQLGEDGRYTFFDGATGDRYQCGVSESLLVKRLAAALQDLEALKKSLLSGEEQEAIHEALHADAVHAHRRGAGGD